MFSYEKFESLCKSRNVTPYHVSSVTGVATSTLSNCKKGTYIPKVDKVQKIADFFDVDPMVFADFSEVK